MTSPRSLMNTLRSLWPRRRPALFVNPLPGFDPDFYLSTYPDVRDYEQGPLHHYLHHGWREIRDPSAGFSTGGYLAENLDVQMARMNPLLHFLEHGLAEGRTGWAK